jgi:hypothetical protein
MNYVKLRIAALSFIFILSSLALADDHHHTMPGDKYGTVNFPTSCAANVQKPFELAVAQLHSFEYETAELQFKNVAHQDPKCAMAYWGQAMSLFHGLWARPSKEDLKRGTDFSQKAQQLNAKTPREREYINAVALLFHDADKIDHKDRVKAYSQAMEKVSQHNPSDREAAIFYALSLLAVGSGDDPELTNDRKAVAILSRLFEQQPDHPGIAHYIIHACDNPQLASLGLPAAREYAKIAPSSAHAVHMPSHIFARVGLWRESIASNAAALKAADEMEAMHLHTMHHRMHAMDYMHYAYLQIGDDAAAQAIAKQMAGFNRSEIEKDYQDYYDDMLTGFAARYAIERRQWKDALALQPIANATASIQSQTYWAHAVAAGHLRDAAAAEQALKDYEAKLDQVKKGPQAHMLDGLKSEHEEVIAWTLYAQGKSDDAIAKLRAVADRQDKVGKGETESPAREMLADMLLDLDRPKEALAEYEVSLKTDPNRFNELVGAARAAEKLAQKEKASGYYAQLLKNCDGVQSDRPEIAQAKTLLAAK